MSGKPRKAHPPKLAGTLNGTSHRKANGTKSTAIARGTVVGREGIEPPTNSV
jgi:hypothetical protein